MFPFFSLGWNPDDLHFVYHKGNWKVAQNRIDCSDSTIWFVPVGQYFGAWLVALHTSLISQCYFKCSSSEDSKSNWCCQVLIIYFSCFSGLSTVFIQWRSHQKSFVIFFPPVFLWVKTPLKYCFLPCI